MGQDIKLKLLTFLEALGLRAIVIPAIQRDYAQGRATTQAENIRNAFVQKLDSVARDRDPKQTLNLDLVYMAKDKANQDEANQDKANQDKANWIPVDGQQRLTTLFLFHLYHLEKASKLTKFRYEVRLSSQAFCKKVVEKRPMWLDALKKGDYASPSEAIHDQTWFRSAWDRDPTVTGMIKTLDEIHEVAQTAKSDLCPNWEEKITFWCYETPEDANEEYRKLNARGSPSRPSRTSRPTSMGRRYRTGQTRSTPIGWTPFGRCTRATPTPPSLATRRSFR